MLLVGGDQLVLETDPRAEIHGPGIPGREHVRTAFDQKSVSLDRLKDSPRAVSLLVKRDLGSR